MQSAGVDGEHVYFLVEDHYFGDPVFYAIIDSLLASGEVSLNDYVVLISVHSIEQTQMIYLESLKSQN